MNETVKKIATLILTFFAALGTIHFGIIAIGYAPEYVYWKAFDFVTDRRVASALAAVGCAAFLWKLFTGWVDRKWREKREKERKK